MNCPHCQTELADTASFCPACGSVIRPPALQTLSYLPAGTPPWPTSVPAHISSAQTMDALAPTVVVPRPTSKAQPPSTPRKRNWLAILAVVILVPLLGAACTLGLLLLNGQATTIQHTLQQSGGNSAGSTGSTNTSPTQPPATSATQTSGNQLPTPQKFQDLTSIASLLGVTLKYPSNWVADPPQQTQYWNEERLYPQQQQLNIYFVIVRYTAQATASINNADDMNQQILQSMSSQSGFSNFQIATSAPTRITISNTTWEEQYATFSDSNGIPYHVFSISVQHKQLYYNIGIVLPDMYYNEAMQKYIQPMLQSVKFVS